jgi:hypothetical protein
MSPPTKKSQNVTMVSTLKKGGVSAVGSGAAHFFQGSQEIPLRRRSGVRERRYHRRGGGEAGMK